jgi:hypothetical protein
LDKIKLGILAKSREKNITQKPYKNDDINISKNGKKKTTKKLKMQIWRKK